MPKIVNGHLDPEEANKIREASYKIMETTPGLVGGDAMNAIAAMCLAAGAAAAWARMDYKDLIGLISSYYESTLKAEIALQLGENFLEPTAPKKLYQPN